jgi:glutamate--glyoxylate aminotransferase
VCPAQAVEEMYKIASINLSPNTIGQIGMSCLVNPPKKGDVSYALWDKERAAELESLRRRAHMVGCCRAVLRCAASSAC